jgi:hypothetical protein
VPLLQGGPGLLVQQMGAGIRQVRRLPCLDCCHAGQRQCLVVCADTAAVCRLQAETEAELAGADAAERDADAGDPGLDPADCEEVNLQAHSPVIVGCSVR